MRHHEGRHLIPPAKFQVLDNRHRHGPPLIFRESPAQSFDGRPDHILDTKTGHFDPAEFEDRYETAVVEMLKQKQAGLPPTKEARVGRLQRS
jgi:hypothetical protein